MYAISPREMMYEQPESALLRKGKETFPRSRVSVRSEGSEGSEKTLSRNQGWIFLYGTPSEPLGSDIEPFVQPSAAKFLKNLGPSDAAESMGSVGPDLGTGPQMLPQPTQTQSHSRLTVIASDVHFGTKWSFRNGC